MNVDDNALSSGSYDNLHSHSQPKRLKLSDQTLETINDDCLMNICENLDFFDMVNLAATCQKLHTFVSTHWFPRNAKTIEIIISTESRYADKWKSQKLSMAKLEAAFPFFGNHVKYLILDGWPWHDACSFATIFKLCPNLEKLNMFMNVFTKTDINILEHVSPSLSELYLGSSGGYTDKWSNAMKHLSKLKELSVECTEELTAEFFKHFQSLSTLDINIPHENGWSIENFASIFDNNVHSLKNLTLEITDEIQMPTYESLGSLIIDKLPKLESMEINFQLFDNLGDLGVVLPNLKSLRIECLQHQGNNSLMRKLSACRLLEDLEILFYSGYDENDSVIKLQSIEKFNVGWKFAVHFKDHYASANA